MGLNAFMTIDGIKGSARQKHVEGKCVVHGVRSDAAAEIDEEAGFPKKGYKYSPLVVTKQVDVASPKIHAAMHLGTALSRVTIDFWRMPPPGGAEERYYTIVLHDVYVMAVKTVMHNIQRPENMQLPLFEDVTFVFGEVEYEYGGCDFKSGERKTSSRPKTAAEFDIPAEAKAKEIAIDLGKSAGSTLAGDVLKLLLPPAAEEPK
jgi:type VI secretion system Hcp family effector